MNYVYQPALDYVRGAGAVLGSFSPLHRGHLDLIYRAKKECAGGVLVVVCGCNGDKGYPLMPLEKRYQMVREFFKDDPLVAVYCLSDDEMGIAGCNDQWDIWLHHFMDDVVKANRGSLFDLEKSDITFYCGEEEYIRQISARGFSTKFVDRTELPISATMIRANPMKYWEYIAWTYHRVFSHNILITGTASEGKTTLVEDIGRYFNLPFSYEWARGYIDRHTIGDWEFDSRDFLAFLDGQFNYNRECIESRMNKGIFVSDTDCLVTKMYAKYYAMDKEMALTMDEYNKIIAPAADAFVSKSRWDKVFVVCPMGVFVDDHTRYMKHGTMEARRDLVNILFEELCVAGLQDKMEILPGGYLRNFNRVKEYINGIMEGTAV